MELPPKIPPLPKWDASTQTLCWFSHQKQKTLNPQDHWKSFWKPTMNVKGSNIAESQKAFVNAFKNINSNNPSEVSEFFDFAKTIFALLPLPLKFHGILPCEGLDPVQ